MWSFHHCCWFMCTWRFCPSYNFHHVILFICCLITLLAIDLIIYIRFVGKYYWDQHAKMNKMWFRGYKGFEPNITIEWIFHQCYRDTYETKYKLCEGFQFKHTSFQYLCSFVCIVEILSKIKLYVNASQILK